MPVLVRHPSSSSSVERIVVEVGRTAARYVLEGRLRVPSARVPRIAEGLWRHTCCELFVRRPGEQGYREFNFSPSGEWAAYSFTRYREGALLRDNALDPRIIARHTDGKLELEAHIDLEGSLLIGLSAVVEDQNGTLSYWALQHPPGKPDFHHPDSFAHEVRY